MSLAATSRRGAALNWRLAVNGIHSGSRLSCASSSCSRVPMLCLLGECVPRRTVGLRDLIESAIIAPAAGNRRAAPGPSSDATQRRCLGPGFPYSPRSHRRRVRAASGVRQPWISTTPRKSWLFANRCAPSWASRLPPRHQPQSAGAQAPRQGRSRALAEDPARAGLDRAGLAAGVRRLRAGTPCSSTSSTRSAPRPAPRA